MAREAHELTDEQWARLAPLLPPQKPRTGRPAKDHRTVVEAICWLGRSGAPWRDLPAEYGPWRTVASRFYRWEQHGVWARVLAALQAQAEARGDLEWLLHYLDSTIVRAHQHAAGQGGAPAQEALGRSRGGFSTKLHLRAEGGGRPVTFVLSGGQEADCRYVAALLEQGAVKSGQGGRPRLRPDRIVGDKGYSYRSVRRYLRGRGIGRVIPSRRDQGRHGPFDRGAYRQRNRVERLINRLKQWRRVATRYEKRARNYLAFVTLAASLLWL